jgi:magnesium-transporting ATPase (P-type)
VDCVHRHDSTLLPDLTDYSRAASARRPAVLPAARWLQSCRIQPWGRHSASRLHRFFPLDSLTGNAAQLLVIIVSSTFYALVDWHASRIMNSIKTLIAEEATVLRDGKQHILSARDLVVGDVVLLSMGDRVPADLRLVEVSSDVKFDRSLLTGER